MQSSVLAVKDAKMQGQRVTLETCPQYLLLDVDALSRYGPYAKCNPPLRARANVESLWEDLKGGLIDFVASDHSPYTDEEKKLGSDSIWKAPPGLSGVDLMIPLLFDAGVLTRGLDLSRFVQLTSTNVARTFQLYPRKGSFEIGADAVLSQGIPPEVPEWILKAPPGAPVPVVPEPDNLVMVVSGGVSLSQSVVFDLWGTGRSPFV